MTTAQLTGRIKTGLCRGVNTACRGRAGNAVAKEAGHGGLLAAVVAAVADGLEKSDSPAGRAVGYGVCGLTLFYMAAHVVKAF